MLYKTIIICLGYRLGFYNINFNHKLYAGILSKYKRPNSAYVFKNNIKLIVQNIL